MRFISLILLTLTIFSPPLWAHGGRSDTLDVASNKIIASEYSAGANPYVIDKEVVLEEDLGLSGGKLSQETGLKQTIERIDHEMGRHDEHKIPEIKLSKHELISMSQKGYGSAVAITLLAGGVFAILNIRRPD